MSEAVKFLSESVFAEMFCPKLKHDEVFVLNVLPDETRLFVGECVESWTRIQSALKKVNPQGKDQSVIISNLSILRIFGNVLVQFYH